MNVAVGKEGAAKVDDPWRVALVEHLEFVDDPRPHLVINFQPNHCHENGRTGGDVGEVRGQSIHDTDQQKGSKQDNAHKRLTLERHKGIRILLEADEADKATRALSQVAHL